MEKEKKDHSPTLMDVCHDSLTRVVVVVAPLLLLPLSSFLSRVRLRELFTDEMLPRHAETSRDRGRFF